MGSCPTNKFYHNLLLFSKGIFSNDKMSSRNLSCRLPLPSFICIQLMWRHVQRSQKKSHTYYWSAIIAFPPCTHLDEYQSLSKGPWYLSKRLYHAYGSQSWEMFDDCPKNFAMGWTHSKSRLENRKSNNSNQETEHNYYDNKAS